MNGIRSGEREITLGENNQAYRPSGMKHELIENPKNPPVFFSNEIAQYIIEQVSSGLSLVAVCKQEGMPHLRTVMSWRAENAEFEESYKQAIVTRARIRHEEAEEEVENLKYIDDKTKAYIADIRNRNRYKLMEIGSPNDYSPKLQMNHRIDGPILNLSLDLSTPQAIVTTKTEIIEPDQSSFKSQTDLDKDQNTEPQQITSSVGKNETVEGGGGL